MNVQQITSQQKFNSYNSSSNYRNINFSGKVDKNVIRAIKNARDRDIFQAECNAKDRKTAKIEIKKIKAKASQKIKELKRTLAECHPDTVLSVRYNNGNRISYTKLAIYRSDCLRELIWGRYGEYDIESYPDENLMLYDKKYKCIIKDLYYIPKKGLDAFYYSSIEIKNHDKEFTEQYRKI